MNTIAQRLKELRQLNNYSQNAIESRGVTQRTISEWEKGNTPQAFDWLKTIAKKYNVSADYILGLTDVPRRLNKEEYLATLSVNERNNIYEVDTIREMADLLQSLPSHKRQAIITVARAMHDLEV